MASGRINQAALRRCFEIRAPEKGGGDRGEGPFGHALQRRVQGPDIGARPLWLQESDDTASAKIRVVSPARIRAERPHHMRRRATAGRALCQAGQRRKTVPPLFWRLEARLAYELLPIGLGGPDPVPKIARLSGGS